MANFSHLLLELNVVGAIYPEQIFRPIGVVNRLTELRHSKVKHK